MEELFDLGAVMFLAVLEGIKKFKYVILAIIVGLVLLFLIWNSYEDARQDCLNKGGVPVASDSSVTCT